jgi:hypothetical protein
MLRATEAWHSPVTEAELAATCGLLDPTHSQTLQIIEQVAAVIDRRPSYRTITPDPEVWWEAGLLSGTLARIQGYGREQRRRVLNDALYLPPLENTAARCCPATFGTLTCCSNSIPRGRSSSIKRFPKRGEVGEAGQKVISLRLQ